MALDGEVLNYNIDANFSIGAMYNAFPMFIAPIEKLGCIFITSEFLFLALEFLSKPVTNRFACMKDCMQFMANAARPPTISCFCVSQTANQLLNMFLIWLICCISSVLNVNRPKSKTTPDLNTFSCSMLGGS